MDSNRLAWNIDIGKWMVATEDFVWEGKKLGVWNRQGVAHSSLMIGVVFVRRVKRTTGWMRGSEQTGKREGLFEPGIGYEGNKVSDNLEIGKYIDLLAAEDRLGLGHPSIKHKADDLTGLDSPGNITNKRKTSTIINAWLFFQFARVLTSLVVSTSLLTRHLS
ncbi:hypothetical protein PGTUg99_023178 [Puccinia graminis f. sp. tritici]|uniref:Uncharacterized protein n=1 Tax=Puccinia graminis f. sp. tritici TaxID=56615 RepID=A0A5B0RR07_PUCGR|nr:hypothetical protein PGTUg99_023178 [Puccinia graminis f. sp. tritici]